MSSTAGHGGWLFHPPEEVAVSILVRAAPATTAATSTRNGFVTTTTIAVLKVKVKVATPPLIG